MNLIGEKLTTSIGLKALNGERGLFKHPFGEMECVSRRSTWIESNNQVPRAVVNRSIEIQPRAILHVYIWTRSPGKGFKWDLFYIILYFIIVIINNKHTIILLVGKISHLAIG